MAQVIGYIQSMDKITLAVLFMAMVILIPLAVNGFANWRESRKAPKDRNYEHLL